MPRPKTLSDEDVLDAALRLIHERGPEALDLREPCARPAAFPPRRWCSASRARRGSSRARAAAGLGPARREDREARAARCRRPPTARSSCWSALSRDYGGIETYAEGLLVLREDLRDPVLRARGAAWKVALSDALDDCFRDVPHAPQGIGLLMASQWQGSLLWWSFDPQGKVERYVEEGLRRFVAAIDHPAG